MRLVCSSLECFATAIAKSKVTGSLYCCRCALKVASQYGTESVESLPGAKFPWDVPTTTHCPHCFLGVNYMIVALTGDCPSCKKPLPGVKG